jgi:hypothetical protein
MGHLNRVVLCGFCARDWQRDGFMGFCAACATSMIGWGGEVAIHELETILKAASSEEETTSES